MKNKLIIIILLLMIAGLLAISKSSIFVESNYCVGCGDCAKVCPTSAIEIVDGIAVIDADKCIKCEICVGTCTYNAIRKNNEN